MPYPVRTRDQWGATGPRNSYSMKLPALGAHVHHTVMLVIDRDGNLDPTDDADDDMRRIEAARPDLRVFPYSECFHPSGIVAEGSGTRVGAHTAGFNSTSFGMSFMGNLSILEPTAASLEALSRRLADKVLAGEMVRDFYLRGHRDRKATECPGNNLYSLLPAIRNRAMQIIANPGIVNPEPEPEPESENDMAIAFRLPDGKVYLCSGLHREHVNEETLNKRAIMGMVQPVPKDDPNKDGRFPMWVRKTNAEGAKIVMALKPV